MRLLFPPPVPVTVPILGSDQRFPVHRVYCMARNHADHAQEMGVSGLEAPFCCLKPADAESLVVVDAGGTGAVRYPPLTQRLHHEIELVVAIGARGRDIPADAAGRYIYGYAVGLDMTRQDLLNDMAQKGRPWSARASTRVCSAGSLRRAMTFTRSPKGSLKVSLRSELLWRTACPTIHWAVVAQRSAHQRLQLLVAVATDPHQQDPQVVQVWWGVQA